MVSKHYYMFDEEQQAQMKGNELNEYNWEVLRNTGDGGPFSLEKSVSLYEENCIKDESYEHMARIISDEINKTDIQRIISLGAGKGVLEWHLKRICELRVECTDYTAEAIRRLLQVNKEIDAAYTFDMLNGDYGSLISDNKKSALVMCRVSTEFTKKQWNKIFSKMYEAGVEYLFFIPTECASLKLMITEKVRHIKNSIKGRRDIFCGWLYSENEFLKMFRGTDSNEHYIVKERTQLGDTAVFFLCRNGER